MGLKGISMILKDGTCFCFCENYVDKWASMFFGGQICHLCGAKLSLPENISLILPHPPVEPNRVKRNIFESGLTLIFYILNIN